MMYYFNDIFFPHFFFGFFLMIGFWAFVIWGIVSFVKSISETSTKGGRGGAENILKERYARGEITKEQFEIMKKDIQ